MSWRPAPVERVIWTRTNVSATDRLVLLALASFANYENGDHAHPSCARLAERAGVSARTVQHAVRRLEIAGWIETTRPSAGRIPNQYRVCLERFATQQESWAGPGILTRDAVPLSPWVNPANGAANPAAGAVNPANGAPNPRSVPGSVPKNDRRCAPASTFAPLPTEEATGASPDLSDQADRVPAVVCGREGSHRRGADGVSSRPQGRDCQGVSQARVLCAVAARRDESPRRRGGQSTQATLWPVGMGSPVGDRHATGVAHARDHPRDRHAGAPRDPARGKPPPAVAAPMGSFRELIKSIV
jgi:hypothetical protein